MRIAFFVQYCHTAGTYFRWHNLAIALKNCGVLVDIYAGDFNYKAKNRVENRDGITYYITPSLISCRLFSNPSDPFSAWRRVLHLPNEKYDVYHLFQPFLQAYKPWNVLRKKTDGIFLYDWDDLWTGGVFKKVNSWKESYVQYVVRKLEQNIPEKADAVTVCSRFLQSKISLHKKAEIIYNGFWYRALPDKQILRLRWNLENDIFYLAYIGKTAAEMDWIAEGMDYLSGSNWKEKVKLIICGPEASTLEVSGLLNHESVIYLGEVKPEEASEIARASDLGLLPLENSSFNQSRFPIKFFDFLTAGTPIYYSAVGDIAIIGNSVHGAFEGPSEKKEWSKNLVHIVDQVIRNPVIVQIENIVQLYSWNANAKKLSSLYASIS